MAGLRLIPFKIKRVQEIFFLSFPLRKSVLLIVLNTPFNVKMSPPTAGRRVDERFGQRVVRIGFVTLPLKLTLSLTFNWTFTKALTPT